MDQSLIQLFENDGYAKVLIELDDSATRGIAEAAQLQADFSPYCLDPDVDGGSIAGAVLTSEIGPALASVSPIRLSQSVPAGSVPPSPKVRVFPILGVALGYMNYAGAQALLATPAVKSILRAEFPNLVRPVQVRASQALDEVSWGVQRLRAPMLWDQGIKGAGVLVGHVDTGVDGNHAALNGAIRFFTQFDLNGDEVAGTNAFDSDDHGTHTAGTIVGRPGPHGSFGMAPEAQLASALVIEGGKVIDRILGGMEWAAQKGAQILSASLGLPGQSPVFEVLVSNLRKRNILPVFAVGNDGPGTSRYPGNYGNVVSVGACEIDDDVAVFSSSQRFLNPTRFVPHIVAPGVDVQSCVPGGFASMSGSSMATPHVAGLAALLLSAHPGASAEDLEASIRGSAKLSGSMVPQRAGFGIPDAPRALAILRARIGVA